MREIAQGVAERLGFSLVDEEIIMRAAAEAKVEPHVVADVERRRSFMDRMLDTLASGSDGSAYVFAGGGGFVAPEGIALDDQLRELIRTAIEETADRGSAVIVAHAASHALAEREDVLRVLATASHEVRVERVAAERELSRSDAAGAVERSDAGRSDYLRRFYGEKTELPTHYDVVVNTDRVSPADAAALVALAAS
jgi:hypothetical protein